MFSLEFMNVFDMTKFKVSHPNIYYMSNELNRNKNLVQTSHCLPLCDFNMSSRKHPTNTSHALDLPDTLAPPFALYASSWPDARCDDARSLFMAASENDSREILVVNLCTPGEIKKKKLTDYLPVLGSTCTAYNGLFH